MSSNDKDDTFAIASQLIAGYRDRRCQHVGTSRGIPSRDEIIETVELLLGVLYPGFFGAVDVTTETIEEHVRVELARIREKLERQCERCFCFDSTADGREPPQDGSPRQRAVEATAKFLACLPDIRRRLVLDAQAAFDGDPAARSLDEIVLAYPGFLAVSVYRIAHELHRLDVPLMPRIMSEWAHTTTGADIHPGARIGERFFIDHATGVVIGETSDIGAGVRLYQGVTLGALTLPRDEVSGRVVRNQKRHPTVEDDVTIYANATVLGGTTVVGRGSVIGGSVFITKSVAPGQRIANEAPRLRVGSSTPSPTLGNGKGGAPPDFDI
jgi:serine O-acetyltransferase